MDTVRIISISIGTEEIKAGGPWYWCITLNMEGGWTFQLNSKFINRPFKVEKDAIADAADFIKLNFKEVRVRSGFTRIYR